MKKKICDIIHPEYLAYMRLWYKWRLTYEGGDAFKCEYLKKYSTREQNFENRKEMTFVPAFAKTGINEIRNSITNRLKDIVRQTTSKSYLDAIVGKAGGVDRKCSTMEYFLDNEVLPELLVVDRVGIYVDMPSDVGYNLEQAIKVRPYVYTYKAEQIKSWTYGEDEQFDTLLLEDTCHDLDPIYRLPCSEVKKYRYYWRDPEGVHCQIYDADGDADGEVIHLAIPMIPFHVCKISSSLMCDIADYQIALMNMASSDVQFIRQALWPVYVEEYDLRTELGQLFRKQATDEDDPEGLADGSEAMATNARNQLREMGIMNGRRFPTGTKFPEWISPDAAALEASMDKQEQMKKEIRTLLYLTLANLQPSRQSSESKEVDISQEENGFSCIGRELELAEIKILEFWQAYENNKNPILIKYPQSYSLKTTEERIDEATKYAKLFEAAPSLQYKKEICKIISTTLLSGRVSYEELIDIHKEIDAAKVITSPEELLADQEAGLVSKEFASVKVRGYPEGEVKKATAEQAEKATLVAEAQAKAKPAGLENPGARGVPELSADPKGDVENDRNKNQPYKPRGNGKRKRQT